MAGRDTTEAINGFITELGVGAFPHTVDESGDLWQTFGVLGQPSWVFVDANGDTELVSGSLGEAGLVERLDALIAP